MVDYGDFLDFFWVGELKRTYFLPIIIMLNGNVIIIRILVSSRSNWMLIIGRLLEMSIGGVANDEVIIGVLERANDHGVHDEQAEKGYDEREQRIEEEKALHEVVAAELVVANVMVRAELGPYRHVDEKAGCDEHAQYELRVTVDVRRGRAQRETYRAEALQCECHHDAA